MIQVAYISIDTALASNNTNICCAFFEDQYIVAHMLSGLLGSPLTGYIGLLPKLDKKR